MPEQEARVRCRYCGSNNFAGTASCWQCNRPLLISQSASDSPPAPAPSYDKADSLFAAPPVSSFDRVNEQQTADKAAIWLGLLFPLIGCPVGIVFMMLDDPRKSALGRSAILWSTIGLVLSVIVSMILAAPLLSLGKDMLPTNPGSHLSLPSDGLN